MRHTANCPRMKPFWDAIFKFLRTVLHIPAPTLREQAIIFNDWKRWELGKPEACALIRHAYGQMYRDFTLVDTQNRPFNWKITFARTLRRFRCSAPPCTATRYTSATSARTAASRPNRSRVPDESLKMFETLITFEKPEYSFQLTQAFVNAIDAAVS